MHPFLDPQVDAEHDRIITLFDELRECASAADSKACVEAKLAQYLIDYLTVHCQREEELMRAHGYQETEEHRLAHRTLQAEFRSQLLPRLAGHLGLEEDLLLVRELFLRHIVTCDEAYGDWLVHHLSAYPSGPKPVLDPATHQRA